MNTQDHTEMELQIETLKGRVSELEEENKNLIPKSNLISLLSECEQEMQDREHIAVAYNESHAKYLILSRLLVSK